MAQYFKARALQSARSSGFKSTAHAVAELIDNSFDANATTVKVIYVEKTDNRGRSYVQDIIVVDDGVGMSKGQLEQSLVFGGGDIADIDELVANKKLGKFGYGLPNSSLSQCPHVDVYSWRGNKKPYRTTLDLPLILQNDSIEVPPPTQDALPEFFDDLKVVIKKKQGTIVHWRRCDRLSQKRATTLINHAEHLLGRIFRHLLNSGRKILFEAVQHNANQDNYSPLVARRPAVTNDPLFLTEQCVLAKTVYHQAHDNSNPEIKRHTAPFAVSEAECKPTNTKLADHCFRHTFIWKDREYHFDIITTVVHKDIQKPGVRQGGSTPVGKEYGYKEQSGSISFVRSDREISSGRYGIYLATDVRHRWWSIEVQFSPAADDLLGVANNKQSISFSKTWRDTSEAPFDPFQSDLLEASHELQVKLSKILIDAHQAAFKIIKKDEQTFNIHDRDSNPDDSLIVPGQTKTTTGATLATDGKRPARFTPAEKQQLYDKLTEKYPEIEATAIKAAIDRFETYQVRGILLYAPTISDQLWSLTPVASFLIIMVNSSHPFYTNIMQPMRDAHSRVALSALELFISSLAWDEFNHFWDNDTNKELLETYRSYVGLHLRRYLLDNQIEMTEDDFSLSSDDNGDDVT